MPGDRGDPRFWAVIPAAGSGSRMGGATPKQYLPLAGATVIEHTVRRLDAHPALAGIVIALAAGDRRWPALGVRTRLPLATVTGGAERHASVANALHELRGRARPEDWVLVHDAARPCLRPSDIDRLLAAVRGHPVGGLLGVPVADTMKRVDRDGNVVTTLDRTGVWRALTPQVFRLADLSAAIERAARDGVAITDEASAMEHAGHRPCMIEGAPDNIKITLPQDLALAELFLRRQAEEEPACA